MSADPRTSPALQKRLAFLERDPDNLPLLADCATAAAEAEAFDLAATLLTRYETLAPLSPPLLNLAGTVALANGDFAGAADRFESLREAGHDAPAIRFNLAWTKAMGGQYADALGLLDDATLAASARAPALKIKMLHHLERYDEALACGAKLIERYPHDRELFGALATLALDAERSDLALAYARRAGDNSEGRAALGVLALVEQDARSALALFDEAIATEPRNPRAWMGCGLAQQMLGDARQAVDALDRGAELFREHVGSWIASGWGHFVVGDLARARERFEKALALDPNFSECHGGLAVVAIAQGRLDEARRACEIALRLDARSFGGALAKSLLLEQEGNSRAAQRIREVTLATPVGGRTIAQALMGFGLRR